MIQFIKYRKIYFVFSGILILASIICLIVFGLKLGIDFTGGSILEIQYKEARPSSQEIQEKLADLELGVINIQPSNDRGVILRLKSIDEEIHQKLIERLEQSGEIEGRPFESIIGPVIGRETLQKTKYAILLALCSIILYVAFAFRKVSRPIRSWQYGLATLIALFHDILIPLGVFSILGAFYGIQMTIPIITALLTVLGYSVNNTVVVFDRIRENLLKGQGRSFDKQVDKSLNQTLSRSINTSLSTLLVLAAIFFLGGESLKFFSLALMIGIIAGTYSSLFLASPILYWWLKRKDVV